MMMIYISLLPIPAATLPLMGARSVLIYRLDRIFWISVEDIEKGYCHCKRMFPAKRMSYFTVAVAGSFLPNIFSSFIVNSRIRTSYEMGRLLRSHVSFSVKGGDEGGKGSIGSDWSTEEDEILASEMFAETVPKLCSIVGRGIRSVKERIVYLEQMEVSKGNVVSTKTGDKLMPVSEVLQRIRWDPELQQLSSDFVVVYKDRFENNNMRARFDQKNENISGSEEQFVFALPQHRIESILFKERTIWDKESRLDRVYGSMNGRGKKITDIVSTSDHYEHILTDVEKCKSIRRSLEIERVRTFLGEVSFESFQDLTNNLRDGDTPVVSDLLSTYIDQAVNIFVEGNMGTGSESDDVILSESKALDEVSKVVALLPEKDIRDIALIEIHRRFDRSDYVGIGKQKRTNDLPVLNEQDISEKFVRGGGSGGQKINKTASKVVLLHLPTQIRVECQDTRSLQQNRKLARKRLRMKVDEFLNGANSMINLKAETASKKKARSKARNKARRKKKRNNED